MLGARRICIRNGRLSRSALPAPDRRRADNRARKRHRRARCRRLRTAPPRLRPPPLRARAISAWWRDRHAPNSRHLAACGEDAVARHQDRERVAPHCLADGTRGARRFGFGGDLTVRKTRPGRDRAHRLVNAAMNGGTPVMSSGTAADAGRAAQQRRDTVDGALHRAGGVPSTASSWRPISLARVSLSRASGKFSPTMPRGPRGDAAAAERRVEQREVYVVHDRYPETPHTGGSRYPFSDQTWRFYFAKRAVHRWVPAFAGTRPGVS